MSSVLYFDPRFPGAGMVWRFVGFPLQWLLVMGRPNWLATPSWEWVVSPMLGVCWKGAPPDDPRYRTRLGEEIRADPSS